MRVRVVGGCGGTNGGATPTAGRFHRQEPSARRAMPGCAWPLAAIARAEMSLGAFDTLSTLLVSRARQSFAGGRL